MSDKSESAKKISWLRQKRSEKNAVRRRARRSVLLVVAILTVTLGACFATWLSFAPLPGTARSVEIVVPEGLGANAIGREIARQGIGVVPLWFGLLARWSGRAARLKAGSYQLEPKVSAWSLIDILARGNVRYKEMRIIEGWNLAQLRQAIANNPYLRHDSVAMSDLQIMQRLGMPGTSPEGWFFPDTYLFAERNSDFAILQRAYRRQQSELLIAWQRRPPGTVLKTPYELLILASVVEKETGLAADRGRVASVFTNRLRIGMPLQTDPTIIYGLGKTFDGNLRKHHLQADTPYNTYLRAGLPPTPIALPGRAALRAALRPDTTPYLYFVARGDGSSQFSTNLTEHNRAVNRFQRGSNKP